MRLRRSGRGPHTSEWASWRRDPAAGDPEDPIVAVTTEDRRITVDPAEARAKLRAAGKKLKHAPKSAWEGPRAWSRVAKADRGYEIRSSFYLAARS